MTRIHPALNASSVMQDGTSKKAEKIETVEQTAASRVAGHPSGAGLRQRSLGPFGAEPNERVPSPLPSSDSSASLASFDESSSEATSLLRRVPSPPPAPPPPPLPPAMRRTPSLKRLKGLRRCPSRRVLGSLAPASRDSVRNATLSVERSNLNDSSNNRAPGAAGEEIAHVGSTDVSTYRWSVAAGGGGDGTALQGDRFSVTVVETAFSQGPHPWFASASLCVDTMVYGLSTQLDGLSAGANLQLQQRHSTVGASLSAHLAPRFVLAAGLGLRFHSEGALSLLEAGADSVRLQQQHRTLTGPQLTGGVGIPWVGVGARVLHTRMRETLLRTWVPREAAQPLLAAEDGSLLQRSRHKLAALGLRAPELVTPQLAWRDGDMGLRVGDELQLTHAGTTTGGVALAVAGTLLGGYGAWQKETVLAVRRRDAHNVDVVVSWRRSHAATGGLEVPILADLHHVRLGAEAVCEGYACDLRDPAAQAAYADMLEGKLPGLRVRWNEAPPDVSTVAHYLQHEELPGGVTRLLLETLRVPKKTARGGGIAVPWYIPHFHLPGLTVEQRESTEVHWQATPREVVYSEHWQTEWHQQAPRLGMRSGLTYVSPEETLVRPEGLAPPERHVAVGMRFTYDRFGGQARRGGLVDSLNRHLLGAPNLPYFIDPDRACGYDLRVQRIFDDEDLQALAHMPPPAAAVQALGARACAELQQALPKAATLAQHREALSAFAQGAPARALGALHRWVDGDDRRLRWQVQYTALPALLQRSRELQLVHAGALQVDAQVKPRVQALHAVRKGLAAELHDVQLDPILMQLAARDQSQATMERELEGHLEALDARLSVEHLSSDEQKALRKALGRKLGAEIL